jgi:hypothetical protein
MILAKNFNGPNRGGHPARGGEWPYRGRSFDSVSVSLANFYVKSRNCSLERFRTNRVGSGMSCKGAANNFIPNGGKNPILRSREPDSLLQKHIQARAWNLWPRISRADQQSAHSLRGRAWAGSGKPPEPTEPHKSLRGEQGIWGRRPAPSDEECLPLV